MKRNVLIIMIGVTVLFVVLFLLPSQKKPRELDWTPSYGINEKNPMGLYVFNKELNKLFKNKKIRKVNGSPTDFLNKMIYGEQNAPDAFISISDHVSWDDATSREMLNAIHEGMNGFISCHYFSAGWLEILPLSGGYVSPDKDFATLSVDSTKFKINSNIQLEHFARSAKPDGMSYVRLGDIETKIDKIKPNFIEISYGKGKLLLHFAPAVFTNYYLVKSNAQSYAEAVMSKVPGKDIVWFTNETEQEGISSAPLSFILSKEALRNAFFMILAGVLLFIIFNAKRKQRIVAIIPPVKNTSVDFVKTIGNLYFQEVDSGELMKMRLTFLKEKLWSEYNISLEVKDQELIDRISSKTGKSPDLVSELVAVLRQKYPTASKEELTKLDILIHKIFY